MPANEESRAFWDSRAAVWNRRATAMASVADVYGLPPLNRLNLVPGDRVLDIGCGPGVTTLAIADLVGPEAEVFGVDISPAMIEAAEARAAAATAPNVRFIVADAQTEALGAGFDALYSRFGLMFFADPAAAFSKLGAALRPGGRFATAVWASVELNPWAVLPTVAAAQVLGTEPRVAGPGEPGPFSLADPTLVEKLLKGAGFNTITNDPVNGTREFGTDTADADVRALVEVGPLSEEFLAADAGTQKSIVDAILDAFAPYESESGWSVPGVARCVTAVRG